MSGESDIHQYFGLSYSTYLVAHRTLLQSMPAEWQRRFVRMLREFDDAFAHVDRPEAYKVEPPTEHLVGDLPEATLARLGITRSDPTDGWYLADDGCHYDSDGNPVGPTQTAPVRYYTAPGEELDGGDRVLVPAPDPVPDTAGAAPTSPRIWRTCRRKFVVSEAGTDTAGEHLVQVLAEHQLLVATAPVACAGADRGGPDLLGRLRDRLAGHGLAPTAGEEVSLRSSAGPGGACAAASYGGDRPSQPARRTSVTSIPAQQPITRTRTTTHPGSSDRIDSAAAAGNTAINHHDRNPWTGGRAMDLTPDPTTQMDLALDRTHQRIFADIGVAGRGKAAAADVIAAEAAVHGLEVTIYDPKDKA